MFGDHRTQEKYTSSTFAGLVRHTILTLYSFLGIRRGALPTTTIDDFIHRRSIDFDCFRHNKKSPIINKTKSAKSQIPVIVLCARVWVRACVSVCLHVCVCDSQRAPASNHLRRLHHWQIILRPNKAETKPSTWVMDVGCQMARKRELRFICAPYCLCLCERFFHCCFIVF